MQAVWSENRQQCDVCVKHSAKADPPNHCEEDGMTGIQEQDKEAGKKEDEGKMQ